jgi:hypothetical protein
MKINNDIIKKYIKIFLITLIIFYVIYLIHYFFYKIPESFENNIDCSLCKLSHNNSKCIHLKNIELSNNILRETDSSFLFCPWESNCLNATNIECCSGNQSDFYNNNFILNETSIINQQLELCFPDFSNNQYCIDLSLNKNIKGMIFKKQLKQRQQFNNSTGYTISNQLYTYTLKNKNMENISDNYTLNHYQYLDCLGNIKSNNDEIFNQEELNKFSSNNYFDVASDASYTTQQDFKYSPKEELKMELQNLLPINDPSNVSASIINQYLSAINRFYENHISNMLGPKTHSFNQEMVFDNNTLETKKPTFFVYNNDPNNEYECQPSITGNPKFKYCGPEPQYTPFQ